MKELQQELIGCMQTADYFNGIHHQVYKLGIFSDNYLRQIKQGAREIKDTEQNRNKVRQLINAYETLLHQYRNHVNT